MLSTSYGTSKILIYDRTGDVNTTVCAPPLSVICKYPGPLLIHYDIKYNDRLN